VIGLAEMMNFPGVVSGDERELAKLALPGARTSTVHAPGVVGRTLNAYASPGSYSDTRRSRSRRAASGLRAGCGC
jgi:adenine deaminase